MQSMERGQLQDWMRRVMAETEWSAAEWASKAKTSPSNITRFLKSELASMPKQHTLDKLSNVAPHNLQLSQQNGHVVRLAETKLPARATRATEVDLQRPIVEAVSRGNPDFPIYASAEGGNGEMILSFDPIEYVNRPLFLENVPGAYGFYCVGSSMVPRYEQGDMLLVRPGRPVGAGRRCFGDSGIRDQRPQCPCQAVRAVEGR
jgi:phage repressor protein C with HTH and peptisase S24 domain